MLSMKFNTFSYFIILQLNSEILASVPTSQDPVEDEDTTNPFENMHYPSLNSTGY
ncbi:hypothetical protein NUSPORA_02129 [Nucleospora cyclopteri]